MFLARQLPLQRGFRGAPSVHQGGSGSPGATFTGPTFASLPWGPCGGANAGRVVDRAPTGSSGRRGGGTGGAGSPVLAAPTGQGGSCRPPRRGRLGPHLLALSVQGGDPLTRD